MTVVDIEELQREGIPMVSPFAYQKLLMGMSTKLCTLLNEARVESRIDESSMSRIWQHVTDPKKSFAVISPERDTATPEENAKNYEKLKKLVRSSGLGFVEFDGGYRYKTGDIVPEKTLFIPNISREDAVKIGSAFGQESVIMKDESGFGIVYTSTKDSNGKPITDDNGNQVQIGDHMMQFKGGLSPNDPETKNFFSALKKGSHRGCKFLFT